MDIHSTQPESHPQHDLPDIETPEQGVPVGQDDVCETDPRTADESMATRNAQCESIAEVPQTLDAFLQSVERKAFVMARYALRNEADALDAVQDAMLKLCEKYADHSCQEWGPLFHRILHNGIMDRHRPRGMNRLKRWMGQKTASLSVPEQHDPVHDLMDSLPSENPGPQDELATIQRSTRIHEALSLLSSQQRDVFLLRRWQGLSVRETAAALNIGEGSVKTHLSRAVSALRTRLQEQET